MATAAQQPVRKFVIPKNSGNYENNPMSEGLHPAVVSEVKDLGIIAGKFGEQHKFVVRFVNEEGQEASRFYTPSINEKSNLYKDWSKVIDLDVDEFDIYSLEGQQCQVLATERVNGKGETVADVSKILKPTKGQNVVPPKGASKPAPAAAAPAAKKAPAKAANASTKKAKQAADDAAALAGTEITDEDIPF